MARSKSSLQIHAEYALVWPLWQAFRAMPRSWIHRISYWILRAIFLVLPKRRRIMRTNITLAFPNLTTREQQKIADDSLDNLAKGLSIFVHMPSLLDQPDLPWIHYLGAEHLAQALSRGRGAIAFNAHIGCWEISSSYVMRRGVEVHALYRPLDNPKIDALVNRQRVLGGGYMMDRRRVIREGLPLLRRNRLLGILVDQNFAGGGVFVDFFGRPAATTPIVSIMARRTGATVLPMHSWWDKNDLYLQWDPPLELSQDPDADKAIAEDTQRMTRVVEGWIREQPGQWLWLHNRWKRQPQG
jgi:KDO2-lipid IV(A) lauroyltransferase